MKKINKFIILLLVVAFYSCEDAIDIEQPGTLVSENAIQTLEDLELALNGAYNFFDNTAEIRFNALHTDEVAIGFDNGGQGVNEYALILTSASGEANAVWVNYYIALSHVNRLITSSANVTPADATEQATYDNILGQAYGLRAFAHLQLQTYFTTDYTDDTALGVVALDYVPGVTANLPRNTNAEVFALINSDLDLADGLLGNNGVTFINTDVTKAMRARMAAYRGDYTTADMYATQLLADYPISDSNTFFNMWDDNGDGESIFKLERSVGDSYDNQGTGGGGWAGSLFAFINSTLSGSPFLEMSRSLYNNLDANDIRNSRYTDPSSVIDPNYATGPDPTNSDILVIRKYPGSGGQPLMNDLKIFRASEMLFIKAEALANNGDLPGAAALIKQLRDNRFTTAQPLPVYANETEAFGDILDERRIELAFEGHRWVDIKRIGTRGSRSIDRDAIDCADSGVCTISNTDHRYTMPIPLSELDVVPALEQNAGY